MEKKSDEREPGETGSLGLKFSSKVEDSISVYLEISSTGFHLMTRYVFDSKYLIKDFEIFMGLS